MKIQDFFVGINDKRCYNKIVILFVLPLILSSCYSVKRFSSEVMYPAKNTINNNITDIVLINKSYLPKSKAKHAGIYYEHKNYFRETYNKDSVVSDNALYSLAHGLKETMRYNVVDNDTIEKIKCEEGSFLKPLLYSDVKTICAVYNTDAAVSLETFYSFDSLFNVYDDGHQIIRMVHLISAYKFYYPDKDGRLYTFANKYYDDTLYWAVNGGFFEDLSDDIISRKDALYEMSYRSGMNFAKEIAPYWQEIDRYYFVNSKDEMIVAGQYADNNEWLKAAEVWRRLTDSDKKSTSTLAKFNMAVASEMSGELDMALYWINKALESKPDRVLFIKYKEQILERIENQKLVDKQMGVQ